MENHEPQSAETTAAERREDNGTGDCCTYGLIVSLYLRLAVANDVQYPLVCVLRLFELQLGVCNVLLALVRVSVGMMGATDTAANVSQESAKECR